MPPPPRSIGRPEGPPRALSQRGGQLLLARDRAARIRFEVQARNEYFDLEPLRRLLSRDAGRVVTDSELIAKKLAHIETC